MQADILIEALKASATQSLTTTFDAESAYGFGHLKDQKSKLGQTLYSMLKPETVLGSHAPDEHYRITNTIRSYGRIISARIIEARQQIMTANPSSKEAIQLKEEIEFLGSLQVLLKKFNDSNQQSAKKIHDIEKILESIIAFGESYVISKAGGYASHYIILLTGLVGIPALGVTLAFPATQILGAMLANKYYQRKRSKAETESKKILIDSTFGLQQIAINFLEFKTIPQEFKSPSQLQFLNSLKKYIALESDINLIIESINGFYVTNQTYQDPANKQIYLRRYDWIKSHINEIKSQIKSIEFGLKALLEKNGFSSQNSKKQQELEAERDKLSAQAALLKDEQALLVPMISDLLTKDRTVMPYRRDPVEHKKQLLQQVNEHKFRPVDLNLGINVRNLDEAKSKNYNLQILSPTGAISPFSPQSVNSSSLFSPKTREINNTSPSDLASPQTELPVTSPSLSPSDLVSPQEEKNDVPFDKEIELLDLEEDSDSSDEEFEIKTQVKTAPTLQKIKTPEPKKLQEEDKSDKIQASTQREIIVKLDKYINRHVKLNASTGKITPKITYGSLRFTSDDNVLKAQAALSIKAIVSGATPPSYLELRKKLAVFKSQYQREFAHGGNSRFIKLILKIEKIMENDFRKPLEKPQQPVAGISLSYKGEANPSP